MSDEAPPHPTIVGIADIAARLGVTRHTVDQWRLRKILPPPKWLISGNPTWHWPDIERWAKRAGRGQRNTT